MQKVLDELLNIDVPVYIAGHIIPDQDSVCSCLAMAELLRQNKKEAYVLLEEKDLNILSWCDIPSYIRSNIQDTEYVFIALDVNETKRLGAYEEYYNKAMYTFNIDHHQGNTCNATHTITDSKSSSTCEIIYLMYQYINKDILSKDICSYLYAGIVNDTNSFTRRISSKTLVIAQELINKGIDYNYIIKKTLTNKSLYEMKALACLVNDMQYDDFHYVIVDMEDEQYSKLTFNQITKKLAEDLRKIEDIDIFVILIKYKDYIKAKTMSNVSECAHIIASLFGGGGHKKEAGFTIEHANIEEIIKRIKVYIKENQPK